MRILYNLSPNHSKKVRKHKDIKFVIIHYTGMQSEIESIKRLKNPKSKVSCHFLINRKGEIILMVKEKFIAWHAGKSRWKNFKNLNYCSIGIELVNKGHQYGYQYFTQKQIKSLIVLCKKLKRKYKIKSGNFLGHSDISPLRKVDPGEKFPWKKLSSHKIGNWYKQKRKSVKGDLKIKKSKFFKNLHKLGYRYFSSHQKSYANAKIIKIFQQRYSPNHVTGKLDLKTFRISEFLKH